MFRKIFSSLIALSVVTSPMSVSANDYMFRYRMPYEPASVTVPQEPDYGAGNDIQAWFVAAVGYPFSKVIPVATHDVAEWVKDSGDLPHGLAIESTSGLILGSAEQEEKTETVWYGVDASGNRIARAQMHFDAFQPVGQVSEVNWYTHTGEYFYSQIPAPEGIDVVRWDPIVDNPEGMTTRNGAFEGRPVAAGTYAVAWRGYDYLDREVAFTYGEFLVENGPKVEFIADQTADKGLDEFFSVKPEVKHSIGTISYSLKPVSVRPSGLSFEVVDGSLTGVYRTFDTSAQFVIQARDSADGTTGDSNVFTLTTLPETLDLTNMPDLEWIVGEQRQRRISGGSANLVFDLAAGTLPDGVDLETLTLPNTARGLLIGTPTRPETQSGLQITASGTGVVPVTSNAFSFRIFSDQMTVQTEEMHVRVNQPFKTNIPVVVEGQDPPYTYASATSGAALQRSAQAGVTFDPADGTFLSAGIAEAGSYDQRLTVRNQSERVRTADQIIRVYNPLSVAYAPENTGYRMSNVRFWPELAPDSIRDPAKFELISGVLPDFLKLNERTGLISGRPEALATIGTYGPFTVGLSDGFKDVPVVSAPFTIKIEDRPAVEISQVFNEVPRFIGNEKTIVKAAHVYDGVTFTVTNPGNMPSTLRISGGGVLLGTTPDPVGTIYSGIVIDAVDGMGYKDTETLTLTVVEPKDIGSIDGGFNRTYTWTKGRDFIGFTLPRVTNVFGQITYTLGSAPFSLSHDPATLALKGNAPDVGTYVVDYTVNDQTARAPVSGKLTFVIQDDMTVTQDDVLANRGTQLSVTPARTNGIGPFKWEILSGVLPATGNFNPMSFSGSTGTISGKPRVETSYPLTLRVTDKTLQTVDVSFSISVDKPLPFSFNYGDGFMTRGRLASLSPNYVNKSEKVEFTFLSGDLPERVEFHPGPTFAGQFRGYPRVDGIYKDIVVRGVDTGTGEAWTETVTINVRRFGEVGLPDMTFKHRAGATVGTFERTATNATSPVTYEIPNNPYPGNVSVDASTGIISASFPDVGRRSISYKATDVFGRSKTASVILDIVDGLSISAPPETAMKQFGRGTVPFDITNLIGDASFVVTSGTLPSQLGFGDSSITGTPDKKERQDNIVVTVTDSYDGATADTDAFVIDVAERDKLTIDAADYEMNRYRDVSFRAKVENEIGTVTWTITPDLPACLTFLNGSISGKCDAMFDGSFVIKAVDSKGGDLGTDAKTVSFKITDRVPPEIATKEGQIAILGQPFLLTLSSKETLGTVTWKLVGGDLPKGVTFDPVTATFSGTPTDFKTYPGIVIEITDLYNSIATSVQKTFVFDVKQDGTPLELSVPGETGFRVGEQFSSAAPVIGNEVGDVEWSATGLVGTGLTIDPKTGVISGTPVSVGESQVTITAKDATGRTISANTTLVVKAALAIVFSTETYLTYNYRFNGTTPNSLGGTKAPVAQPEGLNSFGAQRWSISPSASLPYGLVFNASTGSFDGQPLQLGQFGPFTITLQDSLPGQAVHRNVFFDVTMNDDPIDLTVQGYTTKIGYDIRTTSPQYGNHLGRATFFPENNDLAGTNLQLDPKSGVLTGVFDTPQNRDINIAVSDEYTSRVTSRPLALQVLPLLTLTAPQTSVLEAQAPIAPVVVTPGNVAGVLTWIDLDQPQKDLLPEGIEFDTTTGSFVGETDEIGVFGPFKVKAEDAFHGFKDEGESNEITLDLRPGSLYLAVAQATLADGTKRVTPYSYDFSQLMTSIGISESSVRWSWKAEQGSRIPPGLSISSSTGIVSGTPRESGSFTFAVTVSGGGKTASNTYTLNVVLPDIKLELSGAELTGEVQSAFSESMRDRVTTTNIPVGDIRWSSVASTQLSSDETGGLPPGFSLSPTTGVISGDTVVKGKFKVDVTASWNENNPAPEQASDTKTVTIVIGGKSYKFTKISAGNTHTCGITPEGQLLCWGSNANGRLGIQGLSPLGTAPIPTAVTNMGTGVTDVAAGYDFTCAIRNGTSYCWGSNSNRQIGQNSTDTDDVTLPRTVWTGSGVSAITAGQYHACFIRSGAAYCWGRNSSGQVGDGVAASVRGTPWAVVDAGTVVSISAGENHTCAVTTTGAAKCWGSATSGRLGNGATSGVFRTAVDVDGLGGGVASISAGGTHTCAVTTAGAVKCWGSASSGRVGNGATSGNVTAPTDVIGLASGGRSVSLGSSSSCAVLVNGSVRCWGSNANGQLGQPAAGDYSTPVSVPTLGANVATVTLGNNHTCAVMTDGQGKCWGLGGAHRLGNGSTAAVTVPTVVGN